MGRRRFLVALAVLVAIGCCFLTVLAGEAVAADDVRVEPPSPELQDLLADGEREYQEWVARGNAAPSPSARAARLSDAPYAYLSTVSHKQSRNDWCGPATMAILDHFLRGATAHWSQKTWSAYKYDVNGNGRIEDAERLWTDARGAYPPMMAVGLKRAVRKSYTCFYFPNAAASTWTSHLMNKTQYAVGDKGRPVGYSARIDPAVWTTYNYSHAGHIMCGRGFDWRKSGFPVYVDDPYPENAAPPLGRGSSGGATYGKHRYSATRIAGSMYYVIY